MKTLNLLTKRGQAMRCIICGVYTENLDYCHECVIMMETEKEENWLEWEQFGGAKHEIY